MNPRRVVLALLLIVVLALVAQIHAESEEYEFELPPEILALFNEDFDDEDGDDYYGEDEEQGEFLSESFSTVSRGKAACFLKGLNLRNGPCGSVSSTTKSTVKGTVADVVKKACLGRTWTWIKIGKNWGALETGLVSTNCGSSSGGGGGGAKTMTAAQLQRIIPQLTAARAKEVLPHLNTAMKEASINTCRRMSAFVAQLAHESGGLRWFEEFASGDAYEGRRDLCNTVKGDGRRFKGRGPIQLTGRCNYTAAGKALKLNLVGNPKQVATLKVGFRTSAWYWNSRSLNQYADKHTQASFDTITRRINGGLNGKADRDQYWRRAKSVLGC